MQWLFFFLLVKIVGDGFCEGLRNLPAPFKNDLTVPIIFHIDNILVKKFASEFGPKYRRHIELIMRNLASDVEYLFLQSNMDMLIKLDLLDIRMLKNRTTFVHVNDNASKYLKSYCKWQARKKERRFYYSVLMTGLDLYYMEGKRKHWKSTGRGYMGGLCSLKKSCALLEWHSRNSAYLLAHELAHSLDIPHDGPPNNRCVSRGYVMGVKYNVSATPRIWSPCSRMALKEFLADNGAWCLNS